MLEHQVDILDVLNHVTIHMHLNIHKRGKLPAGKACEADRNGII